MTYFLIFLGVWSALILLSKLVLRWPEEGKEIARRYPKRLLFSGMFFTKAVEEELSVEHLRAFLQFRRRYWIYWSIVGIALVGVTLYLFEQFKRDSESFYERMQETYIEEQ